MTTIKEVIKGIIDKFSSLNGYKKAWIEKHWLELIGEAAAVHALPYKVESNILFVRVDSSVWNQELFMNKRNLINKVNNNKKISYTGFNLLFISGFLIPITEEVISRLWLKFNIYYLPISLSLFAFLFSFVFIFGNEINSLFLLPIEIFKCLLISLLIFVIVLKIVLKNIHKLTLIFKKYI